MDNSKISQSNRVSLGRTWGSKKQPTADNHSMTPPSAVNRKIKRKVPPSIMARRQRIRKGHIFDDAVVKKTRDRIVIAEDGIQSHNEVEGSSKNKDRESIEAKKSASDNKSFIHRKQPVRIIIVGRWRAAWLASTARRRREADEAALQAVEEASLGNHESGPPQGEPGTAVNDVPVRL